MANIFHVMRLWLGVDRWNRWKIHQKNQIDLSNANLRGLKLPRIDLCDANLAEADLHGVGLTSAKLVASCFRGASLRGASLVSADLCNADLREAHLRFVDLRTAKLHGANLSFADLHGAVVLGVDFKDVVLTGACIAGWNTSGTTNFDGAICDYIYLDFDQQERRPREGTFKPGEFAALFQQAIDTVDLIFVDGLDWQSFFASLQEIRQQYDGAEINIQAIEKKSGGAFVVRLEASDSLDKAELQQRLTTTYEENQQLRSQLLKTEGKLEGYKEQLDDFQQKVLQGMNFPKYDLRGTQIAGGVADSVQGGQVGGTINNQANETLSIVEAATEIQNLLKPLEASNPNATEADQTAFLNLMIPPTRRERFIGVLKSAGNDAIEEVPYGTVLKALVEGWQRPNG